MPPLSVKNQPIELDIMRVIVTLTDRGFFHNIRAIPPQNPDEDIFIELLFSALLSIGNEIKNLSPQKRMEVFHSYTLIFLKIITQPIDNLPTKIVNLIPENVRYGKAYRLAN